MSKQENIRKLQERTEVPSVVREKMKQAYDEIRKKERAVEQKENRVVDSPQDRRTHGISWKKAGIIFVAATLFMITVTAAAGVYVRWSDGLKEKLQITEKQEQQLEAEGATETSGTSCTSQGITITAVQSITDQKISHLAFSVKGYTAREGEQPAFETVVVTVGKEEADYAGGFQNFGEREAPVYVKNDGTMEYLLMIDQKTVETLKGKKIQVMFENLGTVDSQAQFVPDIQGSWKLEWALEGVEQEESISVNQKIADTDTTVKKIEITPLSLTICYDMPRKKIIEQIYEDEGVSTRETYEEPWFLYGFRMKDGTVRKLEFQSQEQGYEDERSDAYTVTYATDQIMENEEIAGLLYVKPGGNIQEPEEENLVEIAVK